MGYMSYMGYKFVNKVVILMCACVFVVTPGKVLAGPMSVKFYKNLNQLKINMIHMDFREDWVCWKFTRKHRDYIVVFREGDFYLYPEKEKSWCLFEPKKEDSILYKQDITLCYYINFKHLKKHVEKLWKMGPFESIEKTEKMIILIEDILKEYEFEDFLVCEDFSNADWFNGVTFYQFVYRGGRIYVYPKGEQKLIHEPGREKDLLINQPDWFKVQTRYWAYKTLDSFDEKIE